MVLIAKTLLNFLSNSLSSLFWLEINLISNFFLLELNGLILLLKIAWKIKIIFFECINIIITSKIFVTIIIGVQYGLILIILNGMIIFDPEWIQETLSNMIDFFEPIEDFVPEKIEEITEQEMEYLTILNTDFEKLSLREEEKTLNEIISKKYESMSPTSRARLGFYFITCSILITIAILDYRSR